MKTRTKSLLKTALLSLLVAATPAFAQNVTWTVYVLPASSSTVTWTTTVPAKNGKLDKSGKVTFGKGSDINLQVTANAGYKVVRVMKMEEDVTVWVTRPAGYTFGPVDKAHTILVSSEVVSPVGDFVLGSDNAKGGNATVMGDISGTYTGDVPDHTLGPDGKRPYSAHIAMDESGKLDVMGTVAGVKNKDGSTQLEAGGAVKTIGGEPKAEYKGSGKGTIDDKPSSGGGSATLPLELTNTGGTPSTDGVAKGAVNEDGTKYSEKASSVSVPIKPAEATQVKSTWSFDLKLAEKTVKGKTAVYASGILILTDGTRTSFAEKKTKYSAKTGYAVSFAQGTKVTAGGVPILDLKGKPIKDKKSKLSIKKMTLTKPVATWVPNAGTINYKFLGQKGSGNVVDFLP